MSNVRVHLLEPIRVEWSKRFQKRNTPMYEFGKFWRLFDLTLSKPMLSYAFPIFANFPSSVGLTSWKILRKIGVNLPVDFASTLLPRGVVPFQIQSGVWLPWWRKGSDEFRSQEHVQKAIQFQRLDDANLCRLLTEKMFMWVARNFADIETSNMLTSHTHIH